MARMRGVPILVGSSDSPPYCLVEGFTRCCAIAINARRGVRTEERFQVDLGISSRLGDWRLNDDLRRPNLY